MSISSTASDGTILSTLLSFTDHSSFTDSQPHSLHPFAPESCDHPVNLLNNLIAASNILAQSLSTYQLLHISDPKLLSLFRQYGALSHDLHSIEQTVRQRTEVLRNRERSGIIYGEDIPLDRAEIPLWIVAKVEEWGKAAGMEIFKEQREDHYSFVLGGKVLVIDIVFALNKPSNDSSYSTLDITTVKTSHALLPNQSFDSSTLQDFGTLDDFIKRALLQFAHIVQTNTEDPESPIKAAKMARDIQAHFAYLMRLDAVSTVQGEMGVRWFENVSAVVGAQRDVGRREAEVVARALAANTAPLDIYLVRSHAFPVPYLLAPSVSFLVYISPLAYLTLLRSYERGKDAAANAISTVSAKGGDDTNAIPLDIPKTFVRSALSNSETRPTVNVDGAIIATLVLSEHNVPLSSIEPESAIPQLTAAGSISVRPTFPLLPLPSPELQYQFPELLGAVLGTTTNTNAPSWTLDFPSGIIMTQSRMREIQLIVDPNSAGMQVSVLSFGYASWFDLLLSRASSGSSADVSVSAERYTYTYRSPSAAHPPLRLRLLSPSEPGYVLGRVPVKDMREVMAILEVVKEQCWLNENLKACAWVPEVPLGALKVEADADVSMNTSMTDEERLKALLDGTYKPNAIPVNVYTGYQHTLNPDALFDSSTAQDSQIPIPGMTAQPQPQPQPGMPQIMMSFEGRGDHDNSMGMGMDMDGPSQIQVVVSLDVSRPRGVRVDVSGTLPFTMQQVDALEETVRRGGLFALPGKLWNLQ